MTTLKPYPTEARLRDDVMFGEGHIFRGFIAAEARQHGPLRYAFKPLKVDEVSAAEATAQRLGETDKAKAVRHMAETLAACVTWNSATGEPLRTYEVLQLSDPIFYKMWAQVMGQAPMDSGVESDD